MGKSRYLRSTRSKHIRYNSESISIYLNNAEERNQKEIIKVLND